MKTSEQITEIVPALIAFQADVDIASKDSKNPHFKSSYADLTSIWAAIRPHLAKHNLAVVQSPSWSIDGRVVMTTRIFHKSGQWIEGDFSMKPQQDTPQALGSCITYERRYTIASMLGVVAGEDDDGNVASMGSKPNHKPDIDKTKTSPSLATFNNNNSLHVEWLHKQLENKVANDMWPTAEIEMHGKDFRYLETLVKKWKGE